MWALAARAVGPAHSTAVGAHEMDGEPPRTELSPVVRAAVPLQPVRDHPPDHLRPRRKVFLSPTGLVDLGQRLGRYPQHDRMCVRFWTSTRFHDITY